MDAEDSFESDDDYNENETRLLNKYRNKKTNDSESETEVFGVGASGSENDSNNESDIALSDVEEERDDLPDVRAWGKERKKYYGADYVDQDYGGFQGKDAESAEIEEQEAKNLQTQLIQQLDDDDFAFDFVFKKSEKQTTPEDDQTEETLKTDVSGLSSKEKLQLLQKESPEMFALIGDFETKMNLVKDYLQPILQKHKNNKIPNSKAIEFVQTHYQLISSYLCNIYMYLLLKNNKQLKNHPVIKKLYQYRQLLSQMEPIFVEVIKPQIELILKEKDKNESPKDFSKKNNKKKTLKLLENLKTNESKKQKDKIVLPASKKMKLDKQLTEKLNDEKKTKKLRFAEEVDQHEGDPSEMEDVETSDQRPGENMEIEEGTGKRAITYQIAKNKGLTPHRKKVNRNPRVKHKLKFRKAVIRRKGAVREPRKELSRYGGEVSGIKAYVSKSIKLKS